MRAESPNSTDAGDDCFLMEQFRAGQDDAATKLYLRYAERLQVLTNRETSKKFASRFDPDDVVQSVFRTFFRRVSEGMYDVPPGEELWNLLLVLALNKIRTLAKHHRAQKRDVSNTTSMPHADLSNAVEETSYRALRMAIDEMLLGISDVKRKIIEMRIQGHQIKEIAETTGRSKRTVERIVQDFKTRLAQLIDEK